MILITFDTDYLDGPQLERFVREFPIPGQATFFLWKPVKGLVLGDHELQPHPYFEENKEPWDATLDRFEEQWGRKGSFIRPHSCVYSHMLEINLKKRGYVGISQALNFNHPSPVPQRTPWGLWQLPIYYMEYADLCMPLNWPDLGYQPFSPAIIEQAVRGDGLYVFTFHPMHLLINTQTIEDYQSGRDAIISGKRDAFASANPGYGSRNFYMDLTTAMEKNSLRSFGCHAYVSKLGLV
jgi:hypothetical protein